MEEVHEYLTFNIGPHSLTNGKDTLYFSDSDQLYSHILWKSDGTESGTFVVKDVQLGGSNGDGNLRNINGNLFFTAYDTLTFMNQELWKNDGAAAGTVRVADIYPGHDVSIGYDYDMVKLKGIDYYFIANNRDNGNELWRSNGTTAGTLVLNDINPEIVQDIKLSKLFYTFDIILSAKNQFAHQILSH